MSLFLIEVSVTYNGRLPLKRQKNKTLSRRTRGIGFTLGVTGVTKAASKRAPGLSRRHMGMDALF